MSGSNALYQSIPANALQTAKSSLNIFTFGPDATAKSPSTATVACTTLSSLQ
ncbi:hypothetical protein HanXRQr2_Chr03g0128421 [Helianthus annuus]|uniref:Uncharacterized protein n=1 Tax=Helianthus annuus TaxID=4232 RepID=A0A9K3JIR8_HELAN|nr:hypothetical protein HanXRQr2_Chr03g0128421 [Helianthus annuus]KAJ0945179.1 hypothetical protein HanPSC8_Chr03g0125221 [Helianthus annuus]